MGYVIGTDSRQMTMGVWSIEDEVDWPRKRGQEKRLVRNQAANKRSNSTGER